MSMKQALIAEWRWKTFAELDNRELYELLYLRQQVFIVEQNCPFADADGVDYDAWHLLGFSEDNNLLAYLRVVPPQKKYPEPSIGRVVTSPAARGQGLGRLIMEQGIIHTQALFPGWDIRLSAQCYAEAFYRSLGFEPVGESYLEDDIPHIDMILARF